MNIDIYEAWEAAFKKKIADSCTVALLLISLLSLLTV